MIILSFVALLAAVAPFDVVVRGGLVYDGTGSAAAAAPTSASGAIASRRSATSEAELLRP